MSAPQRRSGLQGERAIQQGNDQEALRHFQAGERALGVSQSGPPASGRQNMGARPRNPVRSGGLLDRKDVILNFLF